MGVIDRYIGRVLPWTRSEYDTARDPQHDHLNLNNHDQQRHDNGRPWYKRSTVYYAAGGLFVIIGIMSTIIASKRSNAKNGNNGLDGEMGYGSFYDDNIPDDDGNSGVWIDPYEDVTFTHDGPIQPEAEVPQDVADSNMGDLSDSLATGYYDPAGWSWDNITSTEEDGSDTPQQLALEWLSGSANYASLSEKRRVQRYALVSFYYSTFMRPHEMLENPTDWVDSTNWLSSHHECTWEGIRCNDDNVVTSIRLVGNALSGTIPVDLALLDQLTTLNLAQNFLYMYDEMLDVFLHMPQLIELVLDDNFVYTKSGGLPPQLSALVNLEKLQMSYNLLQGTLDGAMFDQLQALTHLEIESNYLTGVIPSEIGAIPDLIYLYLRRNSLQINMEHMLQHQGAYPSIFSLWLDSNIVTGSLPTTLGTLTELASFSVTNTTLSGPVPKEISSLSNLQRLWLYDNRLSGALPTLSLDSLNRLEVFEIYGNDINGGMIPQSICTSVAKSSYEYKTVSADCEEVSCSCCTECY